MQKELQFLLKSEANGFFFMSDLSFFWIFEQYFTFGVQ